MKYMTFPSSCSFCCIANMLEIYNIEKEDKDIVIESMLPYIFFYDENEDCFSTGAMLQRNQDYNRFLKKYDLELLTKDVLKENCIQSLNQHIPCMIGLKGEFGKHAMIYNGHIQNKYKFLNPHRKEDGQEDYLYFSKEELYDKIDQNNFIAYLSKSNKKMDESNMLKQSLYALDRYKLKMNTFVGKEYSKKNYSNAEMCY